MLRPRIGPTIGRSVATGLCVGLLLLTACDDAAPAVDREQMAARVGDVLPLAADTSAPLPDDRAGMLRVLAPLPVDALLVVYAIEGPGGIEGSLEVLAQPGGYRRENWTIEVPLGTEEARRLSGSTIQTPQGVWIEGSDPSTVSPSPLGALADAALSLDEAERRAIVEQLETRRAVLEEARADEAEAEQILGIPCRVTRVATIEMCLWEATGLPLRYRSDALELRVVNVDVDASIGDHAFDLPATPPVDVADFDPVQALHRLAKGDLAELSPYLHPGLRLPSA